jgi:AhpD family alkylhydroperoxidase
MTTTDFPALRTELRQGYRDLLSAIPDQMQGFGALHKSAMADGALPSATKELMAMAIGIASRCDGCIALHVHDALRAGATPEQVHEAIGVALMMGGGPASTYATNAMRALAQFTP